jgi:hypothetical protein
MPRELRTLLNANGTPLLELVKEDDMFVMYEAEDMDRQVKLPVSAIPGLIKYLDDLK